MKGMGKVMKQAQKLQAQMAKLQDEMAEKTVETTSGGGMVKVVMVGSRLCPFRSKRKLLIRMMLRCFRI